MSKRIKIAMVAVVILILAAGAFYWYDIRPRQIRVSCQTEADEEYQQLFDLNFQRQADGRIVSKKNTWSEFSLEDGRALRDTAQEKYELCLRRHGL